MVYSVTNPQDHVNIFFWNSKQHARLLRQEKHKSCSLDALWCPICSDQWHIFSGKNGVEFSEGGRDMKADDLDILLQEGEGGYHGGVKDSTSRDQTPPRHPASRHQVGTRLKYCVNAMTTDP
jgi:hypothetical protein